MSESQKSFELRWKDTILTKEVFLSSLVAYLKNMKTWIKSSQKLVWYD